MLKPGKTLWPAGCSTQRAAGGISAPDGAHAYLRWHHAARWAEPGRQRTEADGGSVSLRAGLDQAWLCFLGTAIVLSEVRTCPSCSEA